MPENIAAKGMEKLLGQGDKDLEKKMKALAWMGKNDVRVIEANKPKIIDATDAIVKVTGSTVCGSDVHLLHGLCGIVEEIGPAVKSLKPGGRVVNSFCISFGKCEFCKKKLTTACEKTNASTAEYVRVPLADNNLLRCPDSVADEKGMYISDVLPTSIIKGARRVIGIDNNWCTDYAKSKVKGLETINYTTLKSDESAPSKILVVVPGGVDVIIDATGGEDAKKWTYRMELASGMEQDTSETINEAIYSIKKFGRLGIINNNHFNIGALVELGIRLIGCGQAPVHRQKSNRHWEEIRDMVENGKVDPTLMLIHRFRIDDIDKAYHMHEQRQDGLVKYFVETCLTTL
ncbi:GroES-like protein [Corynascus novoguineensis]|uniref:GroES-like protein n=1 Tax=Corynascus novoguineensis TaxID=1126955 RepID=A0AAN7CK86_9PEZI|nr:GroES-like protein [Corynascus novoguineensis]